MESKINNVYTVYTVWFCNLSISSGKYSMYIYIYRYNYINMLHFVLGYFGLFWTILGY